MTNTQPNPNSNNSPRRFPRFILAGSILAAVSVLAVTEAVENHQEASKPAVVIDARPLSNETKMATSFSPVIKRVSPSVVQVFVTGKATPAAVLGDIPGLDFMPWGRGRSPRQFEMPKQ